MSIRFTLKNTISVLLLFASSCLLAQKNNTHQNLYWYRLASTYKTAKNITIYIEGEQRRFLSNSKINQGLIRTVAKYKWKSGIETGLGFCYFQTYPNDEFYTEKIYTKELRHYQEVNYSGMIGKYKISERYQCEQRYFGLNQTSQNDWIIRHRFRLSVERILYTKNNFNIALSAWNEVMLNSDKEIAVNVFDQNRLGANLSFILNKNVNLELSYFKFYLANTKSTYFFDRNIYRISILTSFGKGIK